MGDWQGDFQLDRLSLYHFLPVTHKGFDYDSETTDLFLALKGFVDFCTWLFGNHWLSAFNDKMILWQTSAPWTSQEPWVLHTCFEQALSYWVSLCKGHGCDFHYVSPTTALKKLITQFEYYLSEERMKDVKESYNRVLSKMIVYPFGTTPPSSVLAGRARVATMEKPHPTSDVSRTNSVTSDNVEIGKKRGRDQQEQKNLPAQNASSKNPPKVRYCYANLASIFKITVTPKYNGGCTTPEGKTCGAAGGNTHFTTSNLPSLSDVISTIRSFSAINPSTTSLVEQLEAKNK
jgi:hypothetical protein